MKIHFLWNMKILTRTLLLFLMMIFNATLSYTNQTLLVWHWILIQQTCIFLFLIRPKIHLLNLIQYKVCQFKKDFVNHWNVKYFTISQWYWESMTCFFPIFRRKKEIFLYNTTASKDIQYYFFEQQHQPGKIRLLETGIELIWILLLIISFPFMIQRN